MELTGFGNSDWQDIFGSISSIKDLIDACIAAYGPGTGEKVSSTTKKKLGVRALQGLRSGQALVQALSANLHELQRSSRQSESNILQASKSHKDLLQQLQLTSDELHTNSAKLHQAEADRLAAWREAEQLRRQMAALDAEKQALAATITRLESELQAAAFGANEASCQLSELHAQVQQLAAAAREAEEGAATAAAAVQAARQEADKERAARQRHEDAVARLTADNLVFMAKLRAAEAAAASATAERDELQMALEEHKGPWMDEVHKGVEQRVREALTRAEQLERQEEVTAKQHAARVSHLLQQQADLEVVLQEARQREAELKQQLQAERVTAAEAHIAAEEASALAAEAQATADARAADLRVAQDSLRAMREECNERWMSERTARAQLAEQQSGLDNLTLTKAQLQQALEERTDELSTQRAVNQQLMLKKEETEWQLMAAIAKLNAKQHAQVSGSPLSSSNTSIANPVTTKLGTTALEPLAASHSSSADATGADATTASRQQQPQQQAGQAASAPALGTVALQQGQQGHANQQMASQHYLAATALLEAGLAGITTSVPTGQGIVGSNTAESGAAATAGYGASEGLCCVPEDSPMHAPAGPHTYPSSAFLKAAGAAAEGAAAEGAAAERAAAERAAAEGAAAGALPDDRCGSYSGLVMTGSDSLSAFAADTDNLPGDMFSLPSLSYGLATLPPPELLAAAASGVVSPSGGNHGGFRHGSGRGSHGGGGVLGLPQIGSSGSLGSGCILSSPGKSKEVVVGATGGLMAPFSPLPGAHSNSLQAGLGAIFPESLTASAVTGEETGSFDLSAKMAQLFQQPEQQQQSHGSEQHWWDKQQEQQSQQQQHQQLHVEPAAMRHAGVVSAVASSAAPAAVPSVNSSGIAVHPHMQQHSHQHHAHWQHQQQLGLQPHPVQHQEQQDTADIGASGSRPLGVGDNSSSHQLHGILVTTHGTGSSGAAHGVSPSASLKSVRFSFEGLDQALEPHLSDKGQLHDQTGNQMDESSRDCSTGGSDVAAGRYASCNQDLVGAAGVQPGTSYSKHRRGAQITGGILFSIGAGGDCSSGKTGYGRSSIQKHSGSKARMVAVARSPSPGGGVGAQIDVPLPRRAPVHPVFGAMVWSPSKEVGASGTAAIPVSTQAAQVGSA